MSGRLMQGAPVDTVRAGHDPLALVIHVRHPCVLPIPISAPMRCTEDPLRPRRSNHHAITWLIVAERCGEHSSAPARPRLVDEAVEGDRYSVAAAPGDAAIEAHLVRFDIERELFWNAEPAAQDESGTVGAQIAHRAGHRKRLAVDDEIAQALTASWPGRRLRVARRGMAALLGVSIMRDQNR